MDAIFLHYSHVCVLFVRCIVVGTEERHTCYVDLRGAQVASSPVHAHERFVVVLAV